MSRIKKLARRLLRRLASEYRINWIYATDLPPKLAHDTFAVEPETAAHRTLLLASSTDKVRNSQSYANAGLAGLVLVQNGHPLAVAHFAEADQYHRTSTWPLRPGEVCLMDIATETHARGRGLAPRLIAAAARHYLAQGRTRLIAFIWWSNTPSSRAFEKAGWRRIGFSTELRFGRHWLTVRIPLRRRAAHHARHDRLTNG